MASPAPSPEHVQEKGHKVNEVLPPMTGSGEGLQSQGHREMETSPLTRQAAGVGKKNCPFT